MRRLVPATLLAISLAVTMTACDPAGTPTPTGSATSGTPTDGATATPTPSPTPVTAPARADLALSPEGMGTLVFGVAPSTAAATQMLVLDPEFCTDANTGYGIGIGPGDPEAALWVPIPAYRDGREGDFGVSVDGGVLNRIDLYDGTIPTTEGVRIGDTRADVVAAYPGATLVGEYLTDIYVITGVAGSLQIEVAHQPSDMTYWEPGEVDTVRFIHAVVTGFAPFTVAASENIAGICPF
ncbi:MAG TPA: hypothetical protein VNS80_04245 [Pseudolysinimonas sp.]|nr:hypothetical protein [Pseudolysinimonas sp.]